MCPPNETVNKSSFPNYVINVGAKMVPPARQESAVLEKREFDLREKLK